MLYIRKPKLFHPRFEVVSCYCEVKNTILFLQRHPNKPQGNTWGVPAGKKGIEEMPLEALIRELQEETGIKLERECDYLGKTFVRYDDYDFIYHTFKITLSEKPRIVLNPQEHTAYRWETPFNALGMSLIQDMDACLKKDYHLHV